MERWQNPSELAMWANPKSYFALSKLKLVYWDHPSLLCTYKQLYATSMSFSPTSDLFIVILVSFVCMFVYSCISNYLTRIKLRLVILARCIGYYSNSGIYPNTKQPVGLWFWRSVYKPICVLWHHFDTDAHSAINEALCLCLNNMYICISLNMYSIGE